MNFKFILWLLLTIINHALGEFLQMSLANVNTSMILMRISGITITACHMECAKQSLCHSIAIAEKSPNKLPDCLLLKEDNGSYGAGNEMTTIHKIGYGSRVNGQWGCWRNISACTVSCGGGVLNQSRDCDSPKPQHGGDNCTGPSNRSVKCNEQVCPVHGHWGNWRDISCCNVLCGGGVLNQSRYCDSPKPAHGGVDCKGPSKRTVKCNEQICPENGSCAIYGYIAINGQGEWGTICDDNFGEEDAKVLCRMAGYNGGAYDKGKYKVGDGEINGISRNDLKIWINGLQCNGHEATLNDCRHQGWGVDNCVHSEDVGIKCYE